MFVAEKVLLLLVISLTDQVSSKSHSAFMNVVNGNLLPALQLPKRRQRVIFSCDYMATCMIPDVDAHMVAIWTEPDGNYFYNAVSLQISGDLSFAAEIRCGVANELALNQSKYDSTAPNCHYYDSATLRYIGNVCCIGPYTGVLERMAAANVIGADIHSHYPDVNFDIRHYFNRTFAADIYCANGTPLHFLYKITRAMHDRKLPYWSPNH